MALAKARDILTSLRSVLGQLLVNPICEYPKQKQL